MRHDPRLALRLRRLSRIYRAERYVVGLGFGAAAIALLLVPVRMLVVTAWPEAAPFLGFGW